MAEAEADTAARGGEQETVVVPDMARTQAAELAWSEADIPEPRRPLPRSLRWLLALVGIGALILGAFVGGRHSAPRPVVAAPVTQTVTMTASPPPTTSTDPLYGPPVAGDIKQIDAIMIDVLKDHHIPVPGNWYVITHAQEVCEYYDSHPGLSTAQAEMFVQSKTIYNQHDANVFIYAATQAHCPEHLPPG